VGLVGALVILSRLDNAFLVLSGSIWAWLRWWQPLTSQATSPKEKWLWRIKTGIAFNAPIIIIMLSYFIWNYIGFGTWTPVSGQVKVWWGELFWTPYGRPPVGLRAQLKAFFMDESGMSPWWLLVDPLTGFIKAIVVPKSNLEVAKMYNLIIAILIVLAFVILSYVLIERKTAYKLFSKFGILFFAIGCGAHVLYYKFSKSVAQREWYWISESIFLVIVFGLLLGIFYQSLLNKENHLLRTLSVAALVLGASFLFYDYGKLISERSSFSQNSKLHYYDKLINLIRKETKPGAVIGTTGAGSIGYFLEDRTVINLDGLINSYEYFQHLQAGTAQAYLEETGLEYVFGSNFILSQSIPYKKNFGGSLEIVAKETLDGRTITFWRFVP
jgi:hypothetical protein